MEQSNLPKAVPVTKARSLHNASSPQEFCRDAVVGSHFHQRGTTRLSLVTPFVYTSIHALVVNRRPQRFTDQRQTRLTHRRLTNMVKCRAA